MIRGLLIPSVPWKSEEADAWFSRSSQKLLDHPEPCEPWAKFQTFAVGGRQVPSDPSWPTVVSRLTASAKGKTGVRFLAVVEIHDTGEGVDERYVKPNRRNRGGG